MILPSLALTSFCLTPLLAIDSVEDSGDMWVRSAGFAEAWEKYVAGPF